MAEGARAALGAAIARLRMAGVEDPPGDARRLLAHALGVGPERLITDMPETLSAAEAARFAAAIAARAQRRPVAQIIGVRLFWGRRFRVTPDVLDPRPETETLVAEALAAPFGSVLDLGTGSGAIVLSLLAERPGARGVGADLSAPALQVAAANARALGLADRVAFVRSDWFGAAAGRFDLIVANPPYLAEAELAGLAPELAHEPRAALSPGGDGLGAYRRIAAGAGVHLRPGGRIIVEIGPTQGPAVATLLREAGLERVRILPDLDGRDRVVAAVGPGCR
jgi:release factor glutamine methyltransferase